MTTTIDVTRRRGDTKRLTFIIKDSTGTIVDINNGFSFIMTVDPSKDPVDDTNNLFQVVGDIFDGTNGRVGFTPLAVDVDALGTYYYDVQMLDPNNEKSTIVFGKFKLVQDITKD